jgi:iron(III) transport system substrate-binding protein
MNSKLFFRKLAALGYAIAALLAPGGQELGAKTAEELLAEINRLPESERQARLEREARKEQNVVWYTGMNRSNVLDLTKAFESNYPFLKVKVFSSSPGALANRVLTENRTKTYLYDVLQLRSLLVNSLQKEQAIMRYYSPQRKFLRGAFYDKQGYVNGAFATPMVFVFNKHLVTREEAPKAMEDLLKPQWKGKLVMDAEASDWLAAVLEFYGEANGKEFAKKLGNQNIQITKGVSLTTQLVAAGEFPLFIDGYLQEASKLKTAGAPIDYIIPKPFVPLKAPAGLFVSSNPPDPHAAALFVDFLLSKKGQDIMTTQGRWVGRTDAKDSDNLAERTIVSPSPEKWGDRAQALIELFDQLIVQKGSRVGSK